MSQRVAVVFALVCLFSILALGQEAGQIVGCRNRRHGRHSRQRHCQSYRGQDRVLAQVPSQASDGHYVLPALRPAEYEIVAESSGFGRSDGPGSNCSQTRVDSEHRPRGRSGH